ncbi:collagen alpha-1(X) chain-like [Acanthaster planci]|uniref:Collagen alpha-1(X) chain-like n=1 Tax=Acanthaster planci TaxID=133434 RepID=A0A8B7ZZ55_ACAPL|nr:collagen alpha-1(X) chain-like [Acanthaster planci]
MQRWYAITFSIAILLGNSVKLRATSTESDPAGGEGPSSQVCPICCQGPAGTPGIQGLPGNQGQLGPAGSKGDVGVKGQKGDIGPTGAVGIVGPKGGDGIGLPGKVGPRGPPGLVGAQGEAGVKGQKGEPWETPGNSAQTVAFTVTRRTDSEMSGSYDSRLSFERFETLLPGTSFDLATGTFTCNVAGTYVFTFSVGKYGSSSLTVSLRKNEDWVVSGNSYDSDQFEQVSSSAVLVLQQGDLVYLTMNGKAWSSSPRHYTSFSGFLLYVE